MSILFINGSPNKNGNTVGLAKELLAGKEYADDQFMEVVGKMKEADVVVLGSPLYWHSMSGAVRNLLDRSYGVVSEKTFRGKKLFFVF